MALDSFFLSGHMELPIKLVVRNNRCRQGFSFRCLKCHLTHDVGRGLSVHQKSNNQSVKSQDFSENENQDHSNEESGLLSGTTDTSVTDDSNSES
jgi:hypothetical protein